MRRRRLRQPVKEANVSPELLKLIDANMFGLWAFALGTLGLGITLGIVGYIRRK